MTTLQSTPPQASKHSSITPSRPVTHPRLSYAGDVKFIIGNRMEATIHSNGSMSYRFIR